MPPAGVVRTSAGWTMTSPAGVRFDDIARDMSFPASLSGATGQLMED